MYRSADWPPFSRGTQDTADIDLDAPTRALTAAQARTIDYKHFTETTLPRKRAGRKVRRHFNDKVAWITGASSGLGEALAKRLTAAGAHVILTGRDVEELARVQRACVAAWMREVREKGVEHGEWKPEHVAFLFPYDVCDTQYADEAAMVRQLYTRCCVKHKTILLFCSILRHIACV